MMQSLGLTSAEEGLFVLQQLISQNIVNASQIKFILSSTKQSEITKSLSEKKDVDTKYMSRHISMKIHYDGAGYNGLASNRNSPDDNSVEKAIFHALEKTCLINSRDDCGYSRSGRTDKGVSAFGQVIALHVKSKFVKGTEILVDGKRKVMNEDDLPRNSMMTIDCFTPSKLKFKKGLKRKIEDNDNDDPQKEAELVHISMSEKDFAQMLNNVLPPTIRVLGWSPVSKGFSARFSTKARTYRYFFVKRDLDLHAMRQGLEYMIGKHDFRNFCKMNVKEVDNFERVILQGKVIMSSKVSQDRWPYNEYIGTGNECRYDNETSPEYRQVCYFEIIGQAFLWHQIRCIVSILFMIGKGLESPDLVKKLLDVKSIEGKPSYPFGPELPLVLHKCEYENVRFGHSVKNLWKVTCDLESKWEEIVLAAERIKNGILSLRYEAEVHRDDLHDFVCNILNEMDQKMKKQNNCGETLRKLPSDSDNSTLYWNDAIKYIKEQTGLKPDVSGPIVQFHIPLLDRCRGTTYEQKIDMLLSEQDSLTKRRYEECQKKKEVSQGIDDTFYKNMFREGGSGFY